MALNKLPPLNLNSPKSVDSSESNEGSNASFKQSARERRRMRIAKQLTSQFNDDENNTGPKNEGDQRQDSDRASRDAENDRKEGLVNGGFEDEEEDKVIL
jgi:hypothetical protein